MPATTMIRAAMARIATRAQVVTVLANAILNLLSPSGLSLVGITLYAARLCSTLFQSVFFAIIKQILDIAQASFAVIAIIDLASAGITSRDCLLPYLNFRLALRRSRMKP